MKQSSATANQHTRGAAGRARSCADAVFRYVKKHPNFAVIIVRDQRGRFVVRTQRRIETGGTSAVAPPGFFAPYYTGELAAEDNRHAARSVFDPADFRE